MDAVTFRVRSSDGETVYQVDFENLDGEITVACSCPAGARGQLCKHKTYLMSGNDTSLVDSADADRLHAVINILKRSDIAQYLENILDAENDVLAAQSRLKGLRSKLAVRLRGS